MKHTAFVLSFFSLFVILQNTSCVKANKYVKEAQTLDSLQNEVLKADSTVKTIDSAKIAGYANHVAEDMELIQMSHTNNMSAGAAEIFSSFNSIRWSLLTIAGKKRPLLTELEKSQKQLKHLSHDLKYDLVAADSVTLYIGYETKKATELIQTSDLSVSEVNSQLPLYKAIAPKADSLVSLLKNHKKI